VPTRGMDPFLGSRTYPATGAVRVTSLPCGATIQPVSRRCSWTLWLAAASVRRSRLLTWSADSVTRDRLASSWGLAAGADGADAAGRWHPARTSPIRITHRRGRRGRANVGNMGSYPARVWTVLSLGAVTRGYSGPGTGLQHQLLKHAARA